MSYKKSLTSYALVILYHYLEGDIIASVLIPNSYRHRRPAQAQRRFVRLLPSGKMPVYDHSCSSITRAYGMYEVGFLHVSNVSASVARHLKAWIPTQLCTA